MRLLLLSVLFLTGCSFGPRPATHPLARSPAGAQVAVVLDTGRVKGELLAADSNGIVVLGEGRIVRVRPDGARSIEVRGGPSVAVRSDPATYLRARERLAPWSRYPQGITPEIERRLVSAYRLAAFEEIGE